MKLDLHQMSRDEKLRAMHDLWEDLAREDAEISSPDWHKSALSEAEARLEQGTEAIHNWDAAKAELRRRAS